LSTAKPAWLVVALLLAGAALVAHACRTCVLTNARTFRELLRFTRVHFIGSVLDGVLPAQLGTDSVRLVATRDGLSNVEIARLIMLDRIVGLFVHGASSALVVATLFRGVYPSWLGVLPWLALVSLGLAWMVARRPSWFTDVALRLRRLPPDAPARSIAPLPLPRCLALVGFAALHMTFLGLAIEATGQCLGLGLPFGKMAAAYPIIAVSGIVTTLSVGGFGVREMSFLAILGPFGVAPDAAVARSVFWFLVTKTGGALGATALSRVPSTPQA